MLVNPDDYQAYGLDPDDASLERRLEKIELEIRGETHNNFQIRAARVVAPSSGGWILAVSPYISVGDTVEVSDSEVNDGLYVVEEIDDGRMRLSGSLFDVGSNRVTLVRYPTDVVEGAIGIIDYERQIAPKRGIASESISRHSVSYVQPNAQQGTVMGYPPDVTAFLKKYRKAVF